jgi:hypothetical protein
VIEPAKKKPAIRLNPGFIRQLQNYVRLMRLDKPIGVWLLRSEMDGCSTN